MGMGSCGAFIRHCGLDVSPAKPDLEKHISGRLQVPHLVTLVTSCEKSEKSYLHFLLLMPKGVLLCV